MNKKFIFLALICFTTNLPTVFAQQQEKPLTEALWDSIKKDLLPAVRDYDPQKILDAIAAQSVLTDSLLKKGIIVVDTIESAQNKVDIEIDDESLEDKNLPFIGSIFRNTASSDHSKSIKLKIRERRSGGQYKFEEFIFLPLNDHLLYIRFDRNNKKGHIAYYTSLKKADKVPPISDHELKQPNKKKKILFWGGVVAGAFASISYQQSINKFKDHARSYSESDFDNYENWRNIFFISSGVSVACFLLAHSIK